MQPTEHFSHREGREIVSRRGLSDELCGILSLPAIGAARGRARQMKAAVNAGLTRAGWAVSARVAETHGLRINGLKAKIGFTLQTGNVARAFYDLLKFQAMHLRGKIDAAVLAVPSRGAASALGNNVANFTRVRSELDLFAHIITTPCWIIAIDEEGSLE